MHSRFWQNENAGKSITALKIELIEKALSDLGCTVRPTAPEHMTTRRLNELIVLFERAWPLVKGCWKTYEICIRGFIPDHFNGNTIYYCEGTICGHSVRDILDNFERDVENALIEFEGKTGGHIAALDMKLAVLDKIAAAYPRYAEECRRQQEYARCHQ